MGVVWTVVLCGGLGLAAYGVARFGLRQPRGLPRTLAAVVLAWIWLTLGTEALGAFGLLSRGPMLGWVALGMAVAWACRLRAQGEAEPDAATTGGAWSWGEVLTGGLVVWASAVYGAVSLLRPVKVVSDGPIYHLYFAARWWKAGRLEPVAAPFGENAATYFPAVGDLWFTWLMAAWGGDRLAKVGQVPFAVVAALAVFALARRLGAGRGASAVAAAWCLTSSPVFLFTFEPNVDTIFVAGYLLSAYFFVRHALGDDGTASLALGALAAGLALGTKAPAVVFVPPLLFLGAVSAVSKGRTPARKAAGVLVVGLLPLAVAGFWFARNAVWTGNPLYPLHVVALGRVWLAGWYGPEVMTYSPYYLPASDWRSLADTLLAVLDPRLAPVWLAAVAGAWAVRARGGSDRRVDRLVCVASALAVANVGLFWLAVPYRTQQRFMAQALGLAAVPLARTLDRNRAVRALGVVLLALHVLTPQGWPFTWGDPPWDLSARIPNTVPALVRLPTRADLAGASAADPASLIAVAVPLGVGLASFAAVGAWSRLAAPRGRTRSLSRWAWAVAATAVLVAAAGLPAFPWGADDRLAFFPNFPDYFRGWMALDRAAGPGGARVAYAGTNIPYYLLGARLRNEVRYVNVDAHRGWLLHDYHREALASGSGPATWPYPRPGWDRSHPDYDAWLANLRAEGVTLLVVTRADPDNGPHNVADRESFPVERVWADSHPEVFEPLYGAADRDRLFRLYRVRPASGAE